MTCSRFVGQLMLGALGACLHAPGRGLAVACTIVHVVISIDFSVFFFGHFQTNNYFNDFRLGGIGVSDKGNISVGHKFHRQSDYLKLSTYLSVKSVNWMLGARLNDTFS